VDAIDESCIRFLILTATSAGMWSMLL